MTRYGFETEQHRKSKTSFWSEDYCKNYYVVIACSVRLLK